MAALGRGFDIDQFRAVLQRKGIARNNLYKLQITPPPGLKNAWRALNMPTNPGDIEDIMLYCDSVTLPGIAMATSDSRPYGYGPNELKAYSPVFNSMQASFIVDAKSYTLSFFRNWMRGMVNYTGEGRSYNSTKVNGAVPFEASYKSEYETTMNLYVVSGVAEGSSTNELNVEIINKITIVRAFPFQLGDLILAYGNQDQYMTLPVTFSYFEWYADNVATTQSAQLGTNILPTSQTNGENLTPAVPGGANYDPRDPLQYYPPLN